MIEDVPDVVKGSRTPDPLFHITVVESIGALNLTDDAITHTKTESVFGASQNEIQLTARGRSHATLRSSPTLSTAGTIEETGHN